MGTIIESTGVKKLSTWDLPDTVSKPDGWDRKTLPEATADNMQIMMDKVNELVQTVNRLTEANKHFNVSQQRELLNSLAEEFNDSTHTYVGQRMIEKILKEFNCG